eukprot:611447-Amorphochlora_amoeboformis.AAC.1
MTSPFSTRKLNQWSPTTIARATDNLQDRPISRRCCQTGRDTCGGKVTRASKSKVRFSQGSRRIHFGYTIHDIRIIAIDIRPMRVRSLWRKLVQAGPMAGRNGGLSPYRPNFSPSAVRLFSKQQKEQAKRNKVGRRNRESTKKKKKKKGKTEERWAPNPELLQAQIDLLKPEQPHEKWFEDRTKEQ